MLCNFLKHGKSPVNAAFNFDQFMMISSLHYPAIL